MLHLLNVGERSGGREQGGRGAGREGVACLFWDLALVCSLSVQLSDMTYRPLRQGGLTSACPPGFRILLQRSHFRQNLCQSFPSEDTFSAEDTADRRVTVRAHTFIHLLMPGRSDWQFGKEKSIYHVNTLVYTSKRNIIKIMAQWWIDKDRVLPLWFGISYPRVEGVFPKKTPKGPFGNHAYRG